MKRGLLVIILVGFIFISLGFVSASFCQFITSGCTPSDGCNPPDTCSGCTFYVEGAGTFGSCIQDTNGDIFQEKCEWPAPHEYWTQDQFIDHYVYVDYDGDGVPDNRITAGGSPALPTTSITCPALDNCAGINSLNQADSDSDGKGDLCDNCPYNPNGPLLGTCTAGTNLGNNCQLNSDCGTGGFCSLNQEDSNSNGVGDACDCSIISTCHIGNPCQLNPGTCDAATGICTYTNVAAGTTCTIGGASGACSVVGICQVQSCTDGIQNGDETDVDCGGSCPNACAAAPPTCSDGIRNQGEQGVDCGGPCSPCASSACDDSQTIIRLYQPQNSHGALWNFSDSAAVNYSAYYKICYNDIFGFQYTGATPHVCTGSNKVVGLSQQYNSHAEIPTRTSYNSSVCYGDLRCTSEFGLDDSCTVAGARVVVRLAYQNNSHISNASAPNANFTFKICCTSSGQSPAIWEDMTSQPISNADLNDKVKLDVLGVTGNVRYVIYKKCSGVGCTDSAVANFTSSNPGRWRANDTGNFSFSAIFSGISVDSNFLNVSGPENNSPPQVSILSPIDRGIYFQNEMINFSSIMNDSDDDFNYTWSLGGGITRIGSSMNFQNENFTYAYGSIGEKTIMLRAIDDRGAITTKFVSVLIINSSSNFSFAYIDSPIWGGVYNKNVTFNGSSSYAINVSNDSSGVLQIVCAAGNCPAQTEGLYNGAHVAISGSPAGYAGFKFFWEFDNNQSRRYDDALYYFWQEFAIPRVHSANLSAIFGISMPGYDSVLFSTAYNVPLCRISGMQSNWIIQNISGAFVISSLNSCYREDGIDETSGVGRTSCCPSMTFCNTSNICESTNKPIFRCINYNETNFGSNTSANIACNRDVSSVGIFSVNEIKGQGYCGSNITVNTLCTDYVTGCSCQWIGNNFTGHCDAKSSESLQCQQVTPVGNCTMSVTDVVDDCAGSGFMLYNSIGVWYGDRSTGVNHDRSVACENGQQVKGLCAKSLMQLPFFTWVNFVIVIAILIVIYFLLSRKKKVVKKTAKKRKR